MPTQTTINLQPYFFIEAEKPLAEHEGLTASFEGKIGKILQT